MKNKFGFNIIFALIAFPIGLALIKDIDFENLTLKKPALDIIYIVTFIFAIYFLFKKKQPKE
jgi:hypothetical protein